MITIGFWQSLDHQNDSNYFFKNSKKSILGEDPIETLKYLFFKSSILNYKIEFLDLKKFNEYDAIIFSNWPINKKVELLLKKRKKPNYLLATEGPTIDKDTWKKKNHSYFRKIFTWNDTLISSNVRKYVKINFPSYKIKNYKIKYKKTKFLVLISSNKKNNHKNDLYKARLNFINWAEKNNYHKFDFYGYGWNNYIFNGPKIIRILNKIKLIKKFFAPKFKNYNGEYFGLKKTILKKYKFSICFENSKNYKGWVTEKIFHCFFSGCVPIYYGASNISKIIPDECYIDYRKYKNNIDLINDLENMSEIRYLNYINNINKYLNGNQFKMFGIEYFVNTIIKEIRNDLITTKHRL
jgi:alpha(1,3/1,4) fucosyltransferase